MKRKASSFITVGISAGLIAIAVWFLQGNNAGLIRGYGWWGSGYHHMMGGSMGWLMIMFWIVLIAAFILFVSWVIDGLRISQNNDDKKETPLEILKKRYARGEIDRDEYNKKREDLLN